MLDQVVVDPPPGGSLPHLGEVVRMGTVVTSGASLAVDGSIAPGSSLTVQPEVLWLNGTGANNAGALQNLAGNNICKGRTIPRILPKPNR